MSNSNEPVLEVSFKERQAAIINTSLYAFEALNYMRLHTIREDDKRAILAFNEFVIFLSSMTFEEVKYRIVNYCAGYTVTIEALIDEQWLSASYYCRILPTNKFDAI